MKEPIFISLKPKGRRKKDGGAEKVLEEIMPEMF